MSDGLTNNTSVLLRIVVALILIFVAMIALLRWGVFQVSTSTQISRVLLGVVG